MRFFCLSLVLAGMSLTPCVVAQQVDPAQTPEETESQPSAELPEGIRKLLLGATEPQRAGMGLLAVEGAVLPERPGLLRRTPYGEWVFVFLDDDQRPRALVLLPCRQLERMVESIEAVGATAIRLTGLLTVYDRVNYLLPSNYAVITPPAEEPTSGEAQSTPEDTPNPLDRIDSQLRDIAQELEAGRERARSLEAPVMAPPAVREQPQGQREQSIVEEQADALQEGDRILRQRARLERVRGLWTLRFDQDEDLPTARTPLIVLPSTALRAMEQAVERYGDQIAFEVSGTIYRYGQQPYVHITMHFVQPLEGLRPRG